MSVYKDKPSKKLCPYKKFLKKTFQKKTLSLAPHKKLLFREFWPKHLWFLPILFYHFPQKSEDLFFCSSPKNRPKKTWFIQKIEKKGPPLAYFENFSKKTWFQFSKKYFVLIDGVSLLESSIFLGLCPYRRSPYRRRPL